MNIFTVNSSDSILHMSTSSYGTIKRYGNNLPTCFNRNKLIHYYRNILKELYNVIFVKVVKQVKILVIWIRKLLSRQSSQWKRPRLYGWNRIICDIMKNITLQIDAKYLYLYEIIYGWKMVSWLIRLFFYTSFSQIVHPADPEDGDLFLLACAICISGLVITVLILLFCWR